MPELTHPKKQNSLISVLFSKFWAKNLKNTYKIINVIKNLTFLHVLRNERQPYWISILISVRGLALTPFKIFCPNFVLCFQEIHVCDLTQGVFDIQKKKKEEKKLWWEITL